MKKPNRLFKVWMPTLRILSLALLLSDCASVRVRCPSDLNAVVRGLSPLYVPTVPVRERINVAWRKGPAALNAEGDVFFVPPDTLRVEIRSEWGASLFVLTAAGADLRCVSGGTPEQAGSLTGELARMGPGLLLPLLTGRPGIGPLFPAESLHVECNGGRLEMRGSGFLLTLDSEYKAFQRIESLQNGWICEIVESERIGNEILPRRVRLKTGDRGVLDLEVLERVYDKPFSGVSILK